MEKLVQGVELNLRVKLLAISLLGEEKGTCRSPPSGKLIGRARWFGECEEQMFKEN